MNKYQLSFLLMLVLFRIGNLAAQVKPIQQNIDPDPLKEQEDLNVFQQWIRRNNPGSFLINFMNKQASGLYDRRDSVIACLNSGQDWATRQSKVRTILMETIGAFPGNTPLNPTITGTLKKEGYRVEKIIFESFPGFYVTGCLFIPDRIRGKAPAILNVIGHNQESFRAPLYQVVFLNLVKKGFIVFAIDPPGQGEHVQYYDPAKQFSSVGYSVIEHCYFGNQCFLSGSSCARYFIWDGMRAIDYLLSRKEVDPERIGVTGFSGGGTVAAYIAAFDKRVKVSVPCSWSTASRRQLETKGAQDAESELYLSLAEGITFEDLLEVRAPLPALLTFVSRDEYLSLQGAREAYAEARKAYLAFGKPENLKMTEDDSKHWMTPKIRSAIYAFFMHHLNVPGDSAERSVEILTEKDLTITPTGQVSTFLGGNRIFDLNKDLTKPLLDNLERSRLDIGNHLARVKQEAMKIAGFRCPGNYTSRSFINGKYQREGYTLGKYAIAGEGDYAIPILLFVPDDTVRKHPALVYLNPGGKSADAGPGGTLEKLVKKGYIVAASDVLGTGETENTAARAIAPGYTGVLTGRSIVGIQAGDIIRIVDYLKNLDIVDSLKIGAVGMGEVGIPLLHAAAFDASIRNIALAGTLISYRCVAMNRFYKIGLIPRENGGVQHPNEVDFNWGVAGALTAYDLPDLIGCLAPRKVILAGLLDNQLEPASAELFGEELSFPLKAFSFQHASGNLKILNSFNNLDEEIDWFFR